MVYDLITPGDRGWTQIPDGRLWREIQDNETHDAERLYTFLGSGPFVWADSFDDAINYDDLVRERSGY